MGFCPHCGKEIEVEGSRFCAECGGELPVGEEPPAEDVTEDISPEEAPTGVMPEGIPADEAPTEVIPAVEEPTKVMPAAVVPPESAPTGTMPAQPGAPATPPGGKNNRKKILIIVAIGLIAVSAIAGGVLGYLEWFSGADDAPKAKTVVRTKTVEVDPEAEALEEPFSLKVDTLDGSIPDDLVEMEYLLAEIVIDFDDGDVYGRAQRPATAGDGTVIQGNETTLEIKGTYRNGSFKGTWMFYRPYGVADLNAFGEIESAGDLTRDEASCLLTGSYSTVTDQGEGDSRDLDVVTIFFKVD